MKKIFMQYLERRIAEKGYKTVYIETASVLKEACKLYSSAGYIPVKGVETQRCDQRLYKNIIISSP
jgi:putative acetyltransferase